MTPEILLRSGLYFNFENPDPSTVTLQDVAWALAYTCRFAGHTRVFYSVAQHSVLVSHIVPPEFALAGLLHDAPEAYVGDVTAPLKQLLPDYRLVEKRVESAVFRRFGVSLPMPAEVKTADLVALATEQRDLMAPHDDEWARLAGIAPLPDPIVPMSSAEAARAFISRFLQLSSLPNP